MKKILLTALASCSLPMAAMAGIEVNQLGEINTMVKITEPQRYLIMPVQESMPDAKVEILVDGNIESTIYVRLADSQIDYNVPLDLTPYTSKGTVLLNIINESSRTHARNVSDYICWDKLTMTDTFDTANTEKYRPAYHHTPLYGWMNDPNGMFYKDGVWHLYYQYNPYGSKWQNMSWGHSSSTDLVNWEHHPEAISPNGLGSIFSGSAVVLPQGEIAAMYTSCATSQVQSLAYSSDDGMTFTNYPGNPVIPNRNEARDPNMFWHEPSGQWVLILAEALEKQMQIYTSPDLKHWTYQSSFGKGYGSQDGVWECPDLFELPVEGSDDKKWVLVCNINPGGPFGGSATQYFVGDFDGKTFTCDTPRSTAKWMDYGKDHYATVSWSNTPDNRRTVIGWMSNWQYANDVPTKQFRSANTLPRDLGLFLDNDGEYYLTVKPVPEMQLMRQPPYTSKAKNLSNKSLNYVLPKANDGICEIVVDYTIKNCRQLTLTLSNEKAEKVTFTIDPAEQTFAMDRTQSGLTNFDGHFPAVTVAPTHDAKGSGSLRIYIDRSSIEAFDGNGRFAMTNLVFPTSPYDKLSISAIDGKARINAVNIYPLSPAKY